MVIIFGCPSWSHTKDPLYMAVFDLPCNEAYSLDRAAVEGAGCVAPLAASWPGKVLSDVEVGNRNPVLTAVQYLQR